jgi:hypothetical protein
LWSNLNILCLSKENIKFDQNDTLNLDNIPKINIIADENDLSKDIELNFNYFSIWGHKTNALENDVLNLIRNLKKRNGVENFLQFL